MQYLKKKIVNITTDLIINSLSTGDVFKLMAVDIFQISNFYLETKRFSTILSVVFLEVS